MSKKPLWKIVAIVLTILATIGIYIWVFHQVEHTQSTVSGFGRFDYPITQADTLCFTNDTHPFTLSNQDGEWKMTAPVEAELSEWAKSTLKQFSESAILTDTVEAAELPVLARTKDDYRKLTPTVKVAFKQGTQSIATLTIGSGQKTAEANSERRWVFVDGDPAAYRIFVPLFDLGEALLQPMSAWRNTRVSALDSTEVTRLLYKTVSDEIELSRLDAPTAANPQGWRLSKAVGTGIAEDALTNFELDERRVATILDLVAPFYVDDFVDGAKWNSFEGGQVAGQIQVETTNDSLSIEIGQEIDFSVYPQFFNYGTGSHFAHVVGSETVLVLSGRRLLGMMPGFSDLRSKKMWSLPTNEFSRIEVRAGGQLWAYKPQNTDDPNDSKAWIGERPLGQTPDIEIFELSEKKLISFVKTLSRLEAVRFTTPEESLDTLDAAEIRVFLNNESEPAHVLKLGGSHESIYRQAQCDDSAVFILSEPVVNLLLQTIAADPAK